MKPEPFYVWHFSCLIILARTHQMETVRMNEYTSWALSQEARFVKSERGRSIRVNVVPVSHTHTPTVEKYMSGKLCERMAEVRAVCECEHAFVLSSNGRIQTTNECANGDFLIIIIDCVR